MGIMVIPRENFNQFNIGFADDQTVFIQDVLDLEYMLRRYECYKKWGFNINLKKTEFLVVNSLAKCDLVMKD